MFKVITIALLTCGLRGAWGAIRIGNVGQEWTIMTERRARAMKKLCVFLVTAGEALEAKVDRSATRRGVLAEVLDRAAYA